MEFDAGKMKQIPLRYRLIAMGFVTQMTLPELDKRLEENGCEKLYARNPVEASLIYAFSRGISYDQWKVLEQQCEQKEEQRGFLDVWFRDQTVTYTQLKNYVMENSDQRDGRFKTQKVTKQLQQQIKQTGSDAEFLQFLDQNWESFRPMREKARYYYCKFLYYYIQDKIDSYKMAKRSGFGIEQALLDLNVLKISSKMRKKSRDEKELDQIFDEAAISFGNLYDAFNYYYFGYISLDWMEILFEYYGNDTKGMSPAQKKELARAIRAYEDGWDAYSDDEVVATKMEEAEKRERLLDQEYALERSDTEQNGGIRGRGYQKNRSGEKSVRNYIKGTLDLDRTTLICYLLFFGKEQQKDQEIFLNRERLDAILLECGYAKLRSSDDFDCFVINYLTAKDRVDYLMESVTESARKEKNFYLYHMYRESVNEEQRLKKLIH